jgi:hypothetical protein
MFIIGPSHARQLATSIKKGRITSSDKNLKVVGYQATPIYSEYIYSDIMKNINENIILYVSHSFRFNMLYESMRNGRRLVMKEEHDKIFKDNMNLFDRPLLRDKKVVDIMDAHLMRWIDFYLKEVPNIKLLFWCEYATCQNAKMKQNTNRIERMTYPDLYEKYKDNSIDIDDMLKSVDYKSIMKDGQHANVKGQQIVLDFLSSNCI